jgi:hypothetical protein
MKQSQPLRVESPDYASFGTARTINSALWFANDEPLEERILGYLGKYRTKYKVKLYSFVFFGSHFHPLAHFTEYNRAPFYRDLNARCAEAVRFLVPRFPGGPLFERRYAEQAVPLIQADLEEKFFYCALQAVTNGLCEKISDYPGYNSFHDAICGRKRKVRVVDWAKYHARKRHNPNLSPKDFTTEYTLEYSRLPGYEHLSQREYKELMLKKLEERRVKIVNAYKARNHRFMTKKELKAVVPGTLAKNPKKSKRHDFRPLILTQYQEEKKNFLEWYFSIVSWYKQAVAKYLAGDLTVAFPCGTYRPPGPLVAVSA